MGCAIVSLSMAKVLIVEDDLQLANMYKTKLEHDGFEVTVANDGKQGLELAKTHQPDAVVLDIMLIDKEYSGLSMLEDLRNIPEGKDVPVLALTNLTKREVTEKAKSLGVKDYLVKAMHTPEDVSLKIREYLSPNSESQTNSPHQPSE